MPNRLHTRRPIEIRFNQFLRGRPYPCRTVDLSPTGLRAQWLEEPADADAEFAVELMLPNEQEPLWVWGHRLRCQDGTYAMRFVSMRDCDRARLEEFLRPSTARFTPLMPEDLFDA